MSDECVKQMKTKYAIDAQLFIQYTKERLAQPFCLNQLLLIVYHSFKNSDTHHDHRC